MNKLVDRRRITARAVASLMAGVLASNALIFPAITLYLGNADRFTRPLLPALSLVLLFAVFFFILVFLALGRVSQKRQRAIAVGFAVLSVLVWVQGSFLVWDYGSLDGRGINWREFQLVSLVDIAVWLALSIGLILLARKREGLVIRMAGLLCALQLATSAYALMEASPRLFADARSQKPDNLQAVLGFSPESNVLHILADGFQADVFEDLITNPKLSASYARGFQGFIFYREALGIFPYTRFSMPAFLSGKVYSNREVKNTYIDGVLSGNTIISAAGDNGFEVDLVMGGGYLYDRYANLPHTNIHSIGDTPGLSSPFADSALLFDLSLFRVTPGALKIFVYQNQKWLLSQVFSLGEALQFSFFIDTYFLNLLTENMHVDRDKPVYKYLHVMNTHNPMVVNEDCSFVGGALPSSRHRLTFQSKCTMDTLARLFDRMRSLGVYDQTTIIIHGDHGGWVGNRRRGPDILLPDGSIAPPWIKSLASPLIAIKMPGSSGPVVTSSVLASLLDIPDTLADIMNWPDDFGHASLRDINEGESRTRYFRFYDWEDNAWEADHTPPIIEFSITGSHYEEPWVTRRIIHAPDAE